VSNSSLPCRDEYRLDQLQTVRGRTGVTTAEEIGAIKSIKQRKFVALSSRRVRQATSKMVEVHST